MFNFIYFVFRLRHNGLCGNKYDVSAVYFYNKNYYDLEICVLVSMRAASTVMLFRVFNFLTKNCY
jgi:hypothetical protein